MTKHGSFAATCRAENYHVRFVNFILAAAIVKVVFHALVMIVSGNGQNFFRALLHDDEFVKIFFDDVRLIFNQKFAEHAVETFATRTRFGILFRLDKVINIFYAALANAETCIRIEHGHIGAILKFNEPPADAAMITVKCHLKNSPLRLTINLAIKIYRAYNTPRMVFAST